MKLWKKKFLAYFKSYILPNIDRGALWTARCIGWRRCSDGKIPQNIFDSQQAESFIASFAKRCGLERLSMVEDMHTFRDTQGLSLVTDGGHGRVQDEREAQNCR